MGEAHVHGEQQVPATFEIVDLFDGETTATLTTSNTYDLMDLLITLRKGTQVGTGTSR